MSRSPLAALLLTAALPACGSSSPSAERPLAEPAPVAASIEAQTLEPPEPLEQAPAAQQTTPAIAAMLDRIERVRELKAKHPVAGEELGRDAVIARIVDKAEKNIPKAALEAQGEMLRAFELIDLDYDFVSGMFALIRGNVAGLYDHDSKTMVLLDDLPEELVEQTLAHELVHALQDQHYDLGQVMKYQPGEGDKVTAQHSLAEGDATSAMFDIALGDADLITPAKLRFMMVASVALSGEGGSTPAVLQSALVAPYIDGFAFVQGLRKRGGWAAVDAAWRRPPTSTEQLLHLSKYDVAEKPLPVPEPPLPGDDWTRQDADVLGEQGLRLVLEQWASNNAEAARSAAGWGGDRYLVAQRKTAQGVEHAVAWKLRFDSNEDAVEAAATMKRTLAKPCSERASLGPLAWGRKGDALALVARGYRRSADGTRASSTASCSDARRWLQAVLAAP